MSSDVLPPLWPTPFCRRSRRGQAIVLVALCLFTLVIFMALATNMGILVNDKIRMQSAADLGAYAASYHEAQVLNRLTELNLDILQYADDCRTELTQTVQIWQGEECWCKPYNIQAESIINTCNAVINQKIDAFRDLASYTNSVAPALVVGRSTLEGQIPGITNDTSRTHFFENSGTSRTQKSATRQGTYKLQLAGDDYDPADSIDAIANFSQAVSSFNYMATVSCETPAGGCAPFGIQPSDVRRIATWFYKPNTDPEVYTMVQVQGTFRSQYLDIAYSSGGNDGGYFGGSSGGLNDLMTAIAIAKPFEGSVGPTTRSGGDTAKAASSYTYGGVYYPDEIDLVKEHMQATYRARLAGVREWERSFVAMETSPMDILQNFWGADAQQIRH